MWECSITARPCGGKICLDHELRIREKVRDWRCDPIPSEVTEPSYSSIPETKAPTDLLGIVSIYTQTIAVRKHSDLPRK